MMENINRSAHRIIRTGTGTKAGSIEHLKHALTRPHIVGYINDFVIYARHGAFLYKRSYPISRAEVENEAYEVVGGGWRLYSIDGVLYMAKGNLVHRLPVGV